MLPPRGGSTAQQIRTNFGRADNILNVITHAKYEISWYKTVPLAKGWSYMLISTTTADAINTANLLDPNLGYYGLTLLTSEISH